MSRKNLQKEQILLKTGNQTWQATAQTLIAHRERLE
jgi:hypothetical protein